MCVDLELRMGSSEVIAGEGTEKNQTKSVRILKGTGIDWRERNCTLSRVLNTSGPKSVKAGIGVR